VVTRNTLLLLGLRLAGPAHFKSGLFYLQYRPPWEKRYCEIYRSKIYGPDLNNRASEVFGILYHPEVFYQFCSNYALGVKINFALGSQFYIELYKENFEWLSLELLMGIWLNLTGMIPGWSPTKFFQTVPIGCISRSRSKKIGAVWLGFGLVTVFENFPFCYGHMTRPQESAFKVWRR